VNQELERMQTETYATVTGYLSTETIAYRGGGVEENRDLSQYG
jgi:hypothetical protein